MSIYIGSRYQTANVLTITRTDGGQSVAAYRGASPFPQAVNQGHYVVVAGDRIDKLAHQFYGRPDFWWVIADANPGAMLADPLPPGLLLVIPDGSNLR